MLRSRSFCFAKPVVALLIPLTLAGTPLQAQPTPSQTAPGNGHTSASGWQSLTSAQRQALQPLAGTWSTLSDTQKKKWLALSHNYASLSVTEQQKLHQRMTEWAALTPKQRTQARLNFSQTQQLPAADKQERWEVYQTFTPEQKKHLAETAPKLPLAPHVVAPKTKAKPASASQ